MVNLLTKFRACLPLLALIGVLAIDPSYARSDELTIKYDCVKTKSEIPLTQYLNNLSEISLISGVNNVNFSGIAATGHIILTYMHYLGTASHNSYLVVVPDKNHKNIWDIVPFEENYQDVEYVDDEPVQGINFQKSVRFFNANCHGKPVTLALITSLLGPSNIGRRSLSRASILVFEFVDNMDDWPNQRFELVARLKSRRKYSNADVALREEFGISLLSRYGAWEQRMLLQNSK